MRTNLRRMPSRYIHANNFAADYFLILLGKQLHDGLLLDSFATDYFLMISGERLCDGLLFDGSHDRGGDDGGVQAGDEEPAADTCQVALRLQPA